MSSLFFAQVGARPDLDLRTAHIPHPHNYIYISWMLHRPDHPTSGASSIAGPRGAVWRLSVRVAPRLMRSLRQSCSWVSNSVTRCECICGRSESGGGGLAPLAAHIECAMSQHRTTCCCRRFILLRASGQLLSSAAHSMMARLCLRFVMRGPMSRMSESAV